jgi:hypothetical protein
MRVKGRALLAAAAVSGLVGAAWAPFFTLIGGMGMLTFFQLVKIPMAKAIGQEPIILTYKIKK